MEQIARIRHMEQLFDLAKEAMEEVMMSLETYEKAQEAIAVLSEYMEAKNGSRTMPTMKRSCSQRT